MIDADQRLRDLLKVLVKKYGREAVIRSMPKETYLEGLEALLPSTDDKEKLIRDFNNRVNNDNKYNDKDDKDGKDDGYSPMPLNRDDHEPPDPPSISVKNDRRKVVLLT